MDETVRHPDQKMRGIISWGKLLPFLMHASQGGVMSGVILSGVTIEYHLYKVLEKYVTSSVCRTIIIILSVSITRPDLLDNDKKG